MKRILKVITVLIILVATLIGCVTAANSEVNIYVEIYEEPIFRFKTDSISVSTETELKLDTNLEISEQDIRWSISDDSVAELADGKIKPLNNGKIVVTAEYLPLNLKAACTVNVKFVVGTPTVTVHTNTYNSLKITYSKESNATYYEIQRATKKNGKYKTIATTSDTSYTDKNLKCGTTYYYRVRAINENNNIKSNYSQVKYKKVTPSKITITSKKAKTYNSTYIKWNKVSGASGYRVYRSTSKNGKYTRLVTTTNLSYTDYGLKSGKTYYYKVRAYKWVNGSKVFGPYSEVFALTPDLATPDVEIYQNGTSVRVKIDKNKQATGYVIYRATSENGKYTKLTTTKKLEYKDYDISYTNQYYYKVRAYKTVSGKKIYSDYTSPIKITTYLPKTEATLSREDTTKIKISWLKVVGCTGYEIYLSQDGTQYNMLKNISGYKTTSYMASNLEVGKKYYIKVRSYKVVNGEKVYSKYSDSSMCTLNEFMQPLKLKTNYNVRSSTSSSYKTIGKVSKNQIVISYGRVGNYYKVKLNNKFGYIHKKYVTLYSDAKVLALSNINQFSSQGGKALPMGCEVTSLAVVLKYLGFTSVTKNMLADKYQPRGKVGSTDPNVAFVGTPYSSKPYGCYAPVIVKTANNYFEAIGNDNYQVNNLTGMDIEDIYKEIDKGNPLIMWITCGKPYKQESWTFNYNTSTTKEGTGTYEFTWYGLQHCVAVAGYNKEKNTLILADVGKSGELTEYDISYLKAGYNALGKQIVSITRK